jgi:hypothetical protein
MLLTYIKVCGGTKADSLAVKIYVIVGETLNAGGVAIVPLPCEFHCSKVVTIMLFCYCAVTEKVIAVTWELTKVN